MAASAQRADKAKKKAAQKPPTIRLPWERHPESIMFDPEEDQTHQSFRDECDVNKIVDLHVRTGIVTHLNRGRPQYGDQPESSLFDAACAQAEIRSAIEEGWEPPPEPSGDADSVDEPVTGSDTETAQKPLEGPDTAPQEPTEG